MMPSPGSLLLCRRPSGFCVVVVGGGGLLLRILLRGGSPEAGNVVCHHDIPGWYGLRFYLVVGVSGRTDRLSRSCCLPVAWHRWCRRARVLSDGIG